jgi:hypothetical protein
MNPVSTSSLIIFSLITTAISAVTDPVAEFKAEHNIPAGDRILKLEVDINGDGRNEMLLCLKSELEKDKEDHEPVAWTFYIARNTLPVTYSKSVGTETKQGELSVDDLPQIDPERCFVGQVTELGKRGIVTIRYNRPREGPPIGIIHAFTVEGDHLKRTELARFTDSPNTHALFAKYLADDKRSVINPLEIVP